MSRNSTRVTAAAVLFTSRIFRSESDGASAGSEQFVEDAKLQLVQVDSHPISRGKLVELQSERNVRTLTSGF